MKDNSWEDELLNDVLEEGATSSFRAGSLHQMLAAVHRRREQRKRIQGLLVASCVVVAIALVMMFIPNQKLAISNGAQLLLVHSHPLPPEMLVATQPGLITMVNSSGSSPALVEAIPARELFEFIDDDRLLALLAGRPAALVYHSPAAAEVVFLNPADADGFSIH